MLNSNALNTYQQTAAGIIEKFNLRQFSEQLSYISSKIRRPGAFVTLLGETTSGKSTLLNGLMGEAVLPVSALPSTAEIIEIELSGELSEPEFYGIRRDGSLDKIDRNTFIHNSKVKNPEFYRIKYFHPCGSSELAGLRLFDSPGFNSIIEQHEEVLTTFLPESDCIIYLVHYRSGVAETDAQFLSILKEFRKDCIPLFLIINRAPSAAGKDDGRIQEILKHVSKLLSFEPRSFIVHSQREEDKNLSGGKVLPRADELWSKVHGWLERPERQRDIQRGILQLQLKLYSEMQKQVLGLLLDEKAREEIRTAERKLKESKDTALALIESRFSFLIQDVTTMVGSAAQRVTEKSDETLYSFDKWSEKTEALAYFNTYFLKTRTETEYEEIVAHITEKLEELNRDLEDLVNTAVNNYSREIERISTAQFDIVFDATKTIVAQASLRSLTRVLVSFGGAGGAGAGVANLAKAGLKQAGRLFGKTFSRQTHNALAAALKRIGLTKWGRVGGPLIQVVVEGIFYVHDSLTWQGYLKKQIVHAVDGWRAELQAALPEEINKLKTVNFQFLNDYFDDLSITPDTQPESGVGLEAVEETVQTIDTIMNEIEQKIKELNNAK